MSVAARQGESGGLPVHASTHPAFPPSSILQRIALACALWIGLLWLPMAAATSLYHCSGAGGEAVYSSTTAGYTRCKLVSTYVSAPRERAPARLADARRPDGASGPSRSHAVAGAFGELQADVVTTARVVPAGSSHTWVAAIQSSVQTTARTIDVDRQPAASSAPRGMWNYQEVSATAFAKPTDSPVDRVLRGAVYRVARGDGSVEYTNVRPGSQAGHAVTMLFTYLATCVACNLHSPIDWKHIRLNVNAYAQTIRAASIESGVDEAFLRAIIHAESAFNPRALSLKGAQGLMQLMPGTAGDMGVRDAFDADQNIHGGARYLAMLLRNFNGNEQLAAAAYNAGAGAVQRYKGVPPYAETQVYVERVGVLRKRYSELAQAPLAAVRVTAGGF